MGHSEFVLFFQGDHQQFALMKSQWQFICYAFLQRIKFSSWVFILHNQNHAFLLTPIQILRLSPSYANQLTIHIVLFFPIYVFCAFPNTYDGKPKILLKGKLINFLQSMCYTLPKIKMKVSQFNSPNDLTLFRRTQISSFLRLQVSHSLKINDNSYSRIFLQSTCHTQLKIQMTVSQCHSPNDFTLFRLTQIPSVFTQIQDLRSLKTNDNLFSGIFCSLRIVLHSKYKCLQDNWILLMISLILELRKSLVFLFKSQFNTYWTNMTIHIPGFFCSLRVIHYSKYIWQ